MTSPNIQWLLPQTQPLLDLPIATSAILLFAKKKLTNIKYYWKYSNKYKLIQLIALILQDFCDVSKRVSN